MIILDTSGLFAALNPDQREHRAARAALADAIPPRALSPFVLAELDYLLAARGGVEPELQLLLEVAGGTYRLEQFDSDDLTLAAEVVQRYRDLEVGLADASIVVLAARYGTTLVLTLDERHFRTIRPLDGDHFTLLPADA